MKRFLSKTVCLVLIFILTIIPLICFDFIVVGNQYLGSYQASLIDKASRLQSINTPKIILIGDSNVAFGFDSKQIEEAFHMPVVNMGLHAGLGNAFNERLLLLGVSEGDIVVICHSSYGDDDTITDYSLAWITVEKHKEFWSLIRPKDVFGMIRAYPHYVTSSFLLWKKGSPENTPDLSSGYSRAVFNEYGDLYIKSDEHYTFNEKSIYLPLISDKCINRLNKLNDYVESKGATMVVAGYPIGDGEYTPSKDYYVEFENELRSKLDFDVISHFTDYFYPYEMFYNTSLHLTQEGAIARTQQLIKDLQQYKADHPEIFSN